MKKNSKKVDAHQVITDKILKALSEGTIPWQRPWSMAGGCPTSLATGKEYRGLNFILLSMEGRKSPYWLTYRKAVELGGAVKKGEKGTHVGFFKMFKADKDRFGNPLPEGEERMLPFFKVSTVFNLEQCKDIDPAKLPEDAYGAPEKPSQWKPQEIAEDLIREATTGKLVPTPKHDGGNRAFYRPSTDSVHLPERERFNSTEEYYNTAFHELSHATGHSTRLDRALDKDPKPFGSADYSREELVAELTACFLMADCKMDQATFNNSASYIESWSKKLKSDKKLFTTASAQASKAHAWITGTYQTV